MGIVGANVDPHDKMRAKDITKVAKGEQAAHPVHDGPLVSKAPPPSSTDPQPKGNKNREKENELNPSDKPPTSDLMRNCCIRYYEYYRCIKENGGGVADCEKFSKQFNAECRDEWIKQWDEERERGTFPLPL